MFSCLQILNWKPKYFKDMYMLPKTMPKSLKSYINERSSEPNTVSSILIDKCTFFCTFIIVCGCILYITG